MSNIFVVIKKKLEPIMVSINHYCSWQWLVLAIFIILFICSQSIIYTLWNQYITPWLIFDYGIPTIIMFGILLIFPIKRLYKRWGKYIYNNRNIFILISIFVILSFFRMNVPTSFEKLIGGITYIDIVLVILLAFIIESIYNYNKIKNNKETNVFLNDDPIDNENDDILNRKKLIPTIGEMIISNISNDSAKTYGIIAPWGYGKTSFINLLKNYFMKQKLENLEIIDFSPWHLPSNVSISEIFFELIYSRIYNFDETLYKQFKKYAKTLTREKNWEFINILRPDLTLENFEEIKKAFQNCNKRFIIFIDDFDRLVAHEMLEIFKLIRGSANFPNLIFIITYDQIYVTETLKSFSVAMNENFIKKFFNYEYNLPSFSKEIIAEYAIANAASFLSTSALEQFKKYLKKPVVGYAQRKAFESFLRNLRDLKKWLNAIKTEYEFLKDEIVIEDVSNIAFLKINYPLVYYAIRDDHDIYLITENDSRYTFFKKKESNTDSTDVRDLFLSLGKKDLMECDFVDHNDMSLINLLQDIFPSANRKKLNNSACYQPYFHRYFYNSLLESDMSDEEFSEFLKLDINQMKNYIDRNLTTKENALALQIERFTSCNDNKIEDILRIIYRVSGVR